MEKIESNIHEIIKSAKKLDNIHPEKAFEKYHRALVLAQQNGYDRLQGSALLGMTYACRTINKHAKGFDYANQALKIFRNCNDSEGVVRAYNMTGILYFYTGIYEQALNCFFKAKEGFEKIDNPMLTASVLNNIGEVYKETENFGMALTVYEKAGEIARTNDATVAYSMVLSNIGTIQYQKGNYNKAFEYYQLAYEVSIGTTDPIFLSELEMKIGKLMIQRESVEEARDYFYKALERLSLIDNQFYAIEILLALYELEVQYSPSQAYPFLNEAHHIAIAIHAEGKLCKIEEILCRFYERKGDFKKALEHFKAHHRITQKLDATNIVHKLEIMKYESQMKHTGSVNDSVSNLIKMEIEAERKKIKMLESVNEELRYKALYDTLTKIPNRRYINEKIEGLHDGVDRSFALYLIDLDNFKALNDSKGHSYGDVCLAKIARTLLSTKEKYDGFVARYGGDEFLFLMEDITMEEAQKIGQELNENIKSLKFETHDDNIKTNVTASIGCAYGRTGELRLSPTVIEIADRLLYDAKNSGRDCLCFVDLNVNKELSHYN